MFERFTERARQVVVLAQEEARLNDNPEIVPAHLLAGLVREEDGLAALCLEKLCFSLEDAREMFPDVKEKKSTPDELTTSDDAKKVLELSLREALSLGHNYIGTEHILLGLIRHDHVILGFHQDVVRNEVFKRLSPNKVNVEPAGDAREQLIIKQHAQGHDLLDDYGIDRFDGSMEFSIRERIKRLYLRSLV